jgi:hypothetical protein
MKTALILGAAVTLFAQTRGIVPEEVVRARPAAKAASTTAGASHAGSMAAKPAYKPMTADVAGSLRAPSSARQVGVTIWRLRPAASGDSGARILVQEESATEEWIPERVSSSSTLKQGDRVRLSIESPDTGHLYVIDRERYRSGERGASYLIFPTSRTRGGDNRVTGGKLVDIPAQEDRPSFFTLRQGRPDQTEEELTLLLTSEPIEGLDIGAKALRLSNEQAAAWEKKWGAARTEVFELSGGAGKAWTQVEQQAGADGSRLLTQDDPPPQAVYRVGVKPGEPVMVKVRLRYGK